MRFQLFQVKRGLTRDYGFMGLSLMRELEITIDINNYDLVYQGETEGGLDELFEIFNIRHPEDFKGRSMSVSDIVKLDDDYYYCDSFGWEKIPL